MQPDGGLAGACVKTEPGTGPGFRAARPPNPPLPPRQRGPSVSGLVKVQHAGPRNLLVLECCVYILFSDDSSNCRTLSWGVLLTHLQISLNLIDISWNRFFRCCCSATKQLLLLSRVRLFAAPWAAAHQAPLSVELSRQEYWRGLPCPSPGDLPDQGSNPRLLHWQADSLLLSQREALRFLCSCSCSLLALLVPSPPVFGLNCGQRLTWSSDR